MQVESMPVNLVAYRAALHARDVLVQLVGDAPWLLRVSVRIQGKALVLAVLVTRKSDETRCCLPSVCNGFDVVVKEASATRDDSGKGS